MPFFLMLMLEKYILLLLVHFDYLLSRLFFPLLVVDIGMMHNHILVQFLFFVMFHLLKIPISVVPIEVSYKTVYYEHVPKKFF